MSQRILFKHDLFPGYRIIKATIDTIIKSKEQDINFENLNLILLNFKQFAKLHRRVIPHKFPKPKRMR